ncbi:MAG: hypothetical protein EBU90_10025 [Proteobacteria bacterium]|nr:hypothetical protein [Pseudomonadota bacterium]NBP16219.1 hypothetical protein [bacterium]
MTKFEQLLDYIVNEEHDKANELFHEIVVEKSREIYENLVAEEETEEDVEEAMHDDDVEESMDDDDVEEAMDDEADESVDLEDSYMMDGDDEMPEPGGLEKTDDLEGDIEFGGEEEEAEDKIKDAIAQLEAALAAIGGGDMGDEMDDLGDEMPDDEMPKEDDMMGVPAFEGRRMTREYREKVGNDWDKNSMKTQGQYVGSGSGDKDGAPVEGRSPIASGSNKPGPAGVNAKNLNQSHHEGQNNTGTSPGKVNHGITGTKGDKMGSGMNNVDGKQTGVKTLSKQPGHGPEKKGGAPGPVGSGSGDKAGQTSIGNQQSLLKSYGK